VEAHNDQLMLNNDGGCTNCFYLGRDLLGDSDALSGKEVEDNEQVNEDVSDGNNHGERIMELDGVMRKGVVGHGA